MRLLGEVWSPSKDPSEFEMYLLSLVKACMFNLEILIVFIFGTTREVGEVEDIEIL